MYEIEIANSQDCLDIDEDLLRAVTVQTLSDEQVAKANISIALVNNATMRELNHRHLDCNYETDVLSFLLECDPVVENVPPASPRGMGKQIEGEVVLSAEMATQRAAEFDWTPREELALYLVHGLLHLVGYDDQTEPEKALMRTRERAILQHFQN